MDRDTILSFGFVAAILVLYLAYSNWRMAVKAALIMVLVEGVFRKWVIPQASDLIYFLKDVILIGAYLRYYQAPKVPWMVRWPYAPVSAVTFACCILTFGLFHPNIGSIPAGLLGLKNYVFYVPLFFLVPDLFPSRAQFKKELSIYVLLGIPVCLLGLAQWRSDAFSVINTYSQSSEAGATTFGSSAHVRITGTFSYLTGHTVFCSIFFALSLALISMRGVPFRALHATVGIPLLLVNALMSGSRAAVLIQLSLIAGAVVSSGVLNRQYFQRILIAIIVCGGISAVAGAMLFPDALEASMNRFQNSGDSIAERTVKFTGKFVDAGIREGGLVGFGLGATSPAVASLRRILSLPQPETFPVPYDFEMGQVLLEVGILGGFFWYLLRFSVQFTIFRSFVECRDTDIKPLLLTVLIVTLPFFLLSVVLNHVAGIWVWSLSGFALWRRSPWND